MTYSIVARDRDTGDLGVAVHTCMFAVGSIVPWLRAGVGAVATQAFVEAAYGPRCLDSMEGGASAADALEQAVASDSMPSVRQVGVVGADGSCGAVTGEGCIDHAGHVVGDGFTAQANMAASPAVWGAMADAYTSSAGPLPRRLLTALLAGEAAGGDARGRMSAAVVVVAGQVPAHPGGGRVVDLRVDRSADPLAELASLVDAAEAFAALDRAVDLAMAGDAPGAASAAGAGLEILPEEGNLRLLRAGSLLASGELDAGVAALRALVADAPQWRSVIRSFVAKGFLSWPDQLSLDDVLTQRVAARKPPSG